MSGPPPGWGLAIDFGTSFTTTVVSSAATLDRPDARAEILEIDGSRYVPSLVCLDEDGTILVGRDAHNESAMAPDRTERVPKRALVASEQVLLGTRTVATVDLVAAVLDRVSGEAVRRFSGRRPARVVLTHPARWQPGGLELTRLTEAADRAGLGPVELVAEPVAAAQHYLRTGDAIPSGGMIGVYDFGGGTFDTAVLRRQGVGFELAGSPGGDVALGGEDLDAAFMEILAEHAEAIDEDRWNTLWEATGRTAERHRTLLRRDITQAKEALSRLPAVNLWVPGYDDEIRVTRREYERAIEPLLARSIAELQDTIGRAGTSADALVDVYLTGSSSRTPRVSALLAELLGHVPGMRDDPKAVVALGALATVPGSVSATQVVRLPAGLRGAPPGHAPAEPTPPLTPAGIPVAPAPAADETETVSQMPSSRARPVPPPGPAPASGPGPAAPPRQSAQPTQVGPMPPSGPSGLSVPEPRPSVPESATPTAPPAVLPDHAETGGKHRSSGSQSSGRQSSGSQSSGSQSSGPQSSGPVAAGAPAELVAALSAEIAAVAQGAGVADLVGTVAPTVPSESEPAARRRLEVALAGVGSAIGTRFTPFPNLSPDIALMVLREGRDELGDLGRCLTRLEELSERVAAL